jgi:hypothetical protein
MMNCCIPLFHLHGYFLYCVVAKQAVDSATQLTGSCPSNIHLTVAHRFPFQLNGARDKAQVFKQ